MKTIQDILKGKIADEDIERVGKELAEANAFGTVLGSDQEAGQVEEKLSVISKEDIVENPEDNIEYLIGYGVESPDDAVRFALKVSSANPKHYITFRRFPKEQGIFWRSPPTYIFLIQDYRPKKHLDITYLDGEPCVSC